MAGSERRYILKTVDGEQYGPVDQDVLIRWAENGRITAYCQIRSTLIARWENASDIPFLRDILLKQIEEETAKSESLFSKIRKRATMKAVEIAEFSGLHEVRPEDFNAASVPMRIVTAITDMLAVLGIAVGIYLFFALLYTTDMLGSNEAFYLGFIVFYIAFLTYFTYCMGSLGQTPGQKFWGVILIRKNGQAFYMGRAYVYTVASMLLGILTPIFVFVSPSHRSFQEIITSTRMVRIKLVGKRR